MGDYESVAIVRLRRGVPVSSNFEISSASKSLLATCVVYVGQKFERALSTLSYPAVKRSSL